MHRAWAVGSEAHFGIRDAGTMGGEWEQVAVDIRQYATDRKKLKEELTSETP